METLPVNVFETTRVSERDTLRAVSTFGQRLRAARDARGYSQEQLGAEVGVTKATVSKWELDRGEPSLAALRGLRATLGLDLNSAICGEATATTLPSNVMGVRDSAALDPYDVATARDSIEVGVLMRLRVLKPRKRAAILELLKPGD